MDKMFGEEFFPDSDEEEVIQPLPNLLQIPDGIKNRDDRRSQMAMNLETEYDSFGIFVPTLEDEEFERKYIISKCMTRKNKKWSQAQNRLPEDVLERIKEGRMPDKPEHKRYVPRTYLVIRSVSCLLTN